MGNSDGSAQSLLVFSREGAASAGPLSVEQAASLEPKSSEAKKSMELVVFWANAGILASGALMTLRGAQAARGADTRGASRAA